jgi:hypothetical protein
MSFQGPYCRPNILHYASNTGVIQNAKAFTDHVIESGPKTTDGFVGKEHIMTIAGLSGAYDLTAIPYRFIVAGLVTLDSKRPSIYRRSEVNFPAPPRAALSASEVCFPAKLTKGTQRILERTVAAGLYPLKSYDHVVRVSDIAELTDRQHYRRTGGALVNAINSPTREKLEIMVDYINSDVIPYNNT